MKAFVSLLAAALLASTAVFAAEKTAPPWVLKVVTNKSGSGQHLEGGAKGFYVTGFPSNKDMEGNVVFIHGSWDKMEAALKPSVTFRCTAQQSPAVGAKKSFLCTQQN